MYWNSTNSGAKGISNEKMKEVYPMNDIKDKIEKTRKILDTMIANQESGEEILSASVQLDSLIEEYIRLETGHNH